MDYRIKKDKFIKWCVAAAAAVLLVFTITLGVHAFKNNEGYRTVCVVETSGTVSVVKDNVEYRAYPGMLLQEGYELVVAGNSFARLVLDNDKYIKVEEGSRLVFETLGMPGGGKTKLKLERGAMTCEVVNPLMDGEEFVVNTPNAILAVRGTFFRVDLGIAKNGEIIADVMTYGGAVSSRRVFPTGEAEDEELLIETGYKTKISMDTEDTVYVVAKTEDVSTAQKVSYVEPIRKEEISDDDLVDIYFAAKNGHELFISAEDAQADIEARGIDLTEKEPVYEKAQEILSQLDKADSQGTVAGASIEIGQLVYADDSKPLVREELSKDLLLAEAIGNTNGSESNMLQMPALVDGLGEEAVTDTIPEEIVTEEIFMEEPIAEDTIAGELTAEATITEEPIVEEVVINEPIIGESLTEELLPEENIETGTVTGESIKTESNKENDKEEENSKEETTIVHTHIKITTTKDATCTAEGKVTVSCSSCGEVISESSIPAKGHTELITQTPATCTQDGSYVVSCAECDIVLSKSSLTATGHNMEVTETKVSTCKEAGYKKSVCENCGLASTEELPLAEHNMEIIESPSTCTAQGYKDGHCTVCEYTFFEEYDALEHSYETKYEEPTESSDGRQYDSCTACGYEANVQTIYSIPLHFSEAAFQTLIDDGCNKDGIAGLNENEVAAVTDLFIPPNYSGYGLAGIELFTNLETLIVDSPSVQAINVSGISSLNGITIDGASSLSSLDVSGTAIGYLDISNHGSLSYVLANNCTSLISLSADGCQMLGELEASKCTNLVTASFRGASSLWHIDMSNNTAMTGLYVNDCTYLTSNLNVNGCSTNLFIYVSGTTLDSTNILGFADGMTIVNS